MALAAMVPADTVANFTQFCAWAATQRHADIAAVVAAFTTPEDALDLLATGSGSIMVPLRGVRHAGSALLLAQLRPGDPLALVRDHGNEFDANAIAVQANGLHAGYLARESARILGPLLDDQDGLAITAVLASRQGVSSAATRDLAPVRRTRHGPDPGHRDATRHRHAVTQGPGAATPGK